MTLINETIQHHWTEITPCSIRNEREYKAAVKRLNALLDEIGDDEKHALYGLLDTLGSLVHVYEEEHIPIPG
jgi:HTH-type transcriptional regulator/antitoxin HigA